MVATVSKANSVGYYLGGGGGAEDEREKAKSYYLAGVANGEPPGRWSGKLAAELGLKGVVRGPVMEQVYEQRIAPDGTKLGNAPRKYRSVDERLAEALEAEPGALPERVEALRRSIEGSTNEACLGQDITLSPPKSYTAAHTALWRAQVEAERRGDEAEAQVYASMKDRLEGALWKANAAMLDYASEAATSRRGTHGRGRQGWWVEAPDLIVSSFHQHTGRANKGDDKATIDPQQHIHNVIANAVRGSDGEIRTLDTTDLGWHGQAFSAVGDRVLAEELARLGFDMRFDPANKAWEIAGVSRTTIDMFSTRRGAITAKTAELVADLEGRWGRPVTELERRELSSKAWQMTRAMKESAESDWVAHLDEWQARLQDQTGRGLVPLAAQLRYAVELADREREAGVEREAERFSPAAVLGMAREAVQLAAVAATAHRKGTWTESDLMHEVARALPLMPELTPRQTTDLIRTLTSEAIESVTQVAGRDSLPSLGKDTPGLGFIAPFQRRYAAPDTILGEQRIRDAAVERGRFTVGREEAAAWLDEHHPELGADQRAMVEGIATSDAFWAMILGKAGTGKSHAAGALAGLWDAHSGGGRVIGLSTGESAADVLREDGLSVTANIDRFLAAQERLAEGRGRPDDEPYRLGPRDILLVDEASMSASDKMDRLRALAQEVGAGMAPMGDPRQMGAIGAGGVMDLLAGRAETYTLTEIRRFHEQWEREASVRLWDGDVEALAEYDRRGRLVDYADMPEAIRAAARAAAADILDGKSTLVVAGSNEEAGAISAAVRALLVEAERVEGSGVELGLDENTAGPGDLVMTRKNDYAVGVLNRAKFTVGHVTDDGSLVLADQDGVEKVIPREYVEQHVQLGYAATVHGAQGQTVDRAHLVTDGRGGANALYTGITRGRERNTVHVSLSTPDKGLEKQTHRGEMRVEEGAERPSAYSVLKKIMDRESEATSALVALEQDDIRQAGAKHLLERREAVTDLAVRDRLEQHLDDLAAEGLLSVTDRAALCADQGTGHVARLLRAVEQTGVDPYGALRDALGATGLSGARSPAQVLSSRLTAGRDLTAAAPGGAVPSGIGATYRAHLEAIEERLQDRSRVLGSELSVEVPAWAVTVLGPVPDDPTARLDWEAKAGQVQAYREATGWTSERRPIPEAPGVTSTEHRASWWSAWDALGRPEAVREEAGMTDARLQTRVAAWEREKQWLPPHADEAMKAAELAAETARQDAILARARGEEEAAAELETQARERLDAAAATLRVADGRQAAYEETAETRAAAGRARAELRDRNIEPGAEPDRVTAEEWLAEHARDRDAVEAERVEVAEVEVRDRVSEEVREMDHGRDVTAEAVVDLEAELPDAGPNSSHRVVDREATAESMQPLVEQAGAGLDRIADRESAEATYEATAPELVDEAVAEIVPLEVSR